MTKEQIAIHNAALAEVETRIRQYREGLLRIDEVICAIRVTTTLAEMDANSA